MNDTTLNAAGCEAQAVPDRSVPGPEPVFAPLFAVAIGIAVCVTLLLRFAQPVMSTDLWWQMAYGRYFVENATLVPDHTIFSWTPADGQHIYCAWTAEILLYWLYRLGGLPVLVVMRYLGLATLLAAIAAVAHQRQLLRHPLPWLVSLVALLMSVTACVAKPELFSFVFMILTVWVWTRIRASNDTARRWCYALPALMLLWVNSHGGFIFGLTFVGMMWIGEEMNALYNPEQALPCRVRRHLLVAAALCVLATLLTPYGWRYPLYLMRELSGQSIAELKTVRAYDSPFAVRASGLHLLPCMLMAAATLLALALPMLRRKRCDWALTLTNLVFAWLYAQFLRTTFYWAPVFALSAVLLLAEHPRWAFPRSRLRRHIVGLSCLALALVLSALAVWQHATCNQWFRWLGFGVSYISPVEEAEFIKRNYPGRRLGNDYSGGGYLLWALAPETKVFIDPRYFPYKSWYRQYYDAVADVRDLEGFLRSYPCDLWCVLLPMRRTVSWFLESPEWSPVFYSASSAVFARRTAAAGPPTVRHGNGIDDIRSLPQALAVLSFALNVRDLEGAERIVAGMTHRFRSAARQGYVDRAQALLQGVRAYFQGDYEQAVRSLEKAPASATMHLVQAYQHLAADRWKEHKAEEALRFAAAALAVKPDYTLALYNAGVAEWYLCRSGNAEQPPSGPVDTAVGKGRWRTNLRRFLARAEDTSGIPAKAVEIARAIVGETFDGRPPLLVPPELRRDDLRGR